MTHALEAMLKSERTLVMGVVNVTPDSFSDGGLHAEPDAAVAHGLRLLDQGADILDVGGESTAPGSGDVSAEEEIRRVAPVIRALTERGAYVSADTHKAAVASGALDAGAAMINDVTALRGDTDMPGVLAASDCDVCIMYSKDSTARTTLDVHAYRDVVAEIGMFLLGRIRFAGERGISPSRIVVDPGMGAFVSGDPAPSLELLRRLGELSALSRPVLVGASRKGFISKASGVEAGDRLEGSLACAAIAAWNGARIVRVHDVEETVRLVRMVDAIRGS